MKSTESKVSRKTYGRAISTRIRGVHPARNSQFVTCPAHACCTAYGVLGYVRDARVQGCRSSANTYEWKMLNLSVCLDREREREWKVYQGEPFLLSNRSGVRREHGKCALHETDITRRGSGNNSQGRMRRATYVSSERETKRSEASRGESRRVEAAVRRA